MKNLYDIVKIQNIKPTKQKNKYRRIIYTVLQTI